MEGFRQVGAEHATLDEVWYPVWGEEEQVRNHYNELLVQLEQERTGRLLNIRFRLFDDGLGFRYEFPDQEKLIYFTVREEATEFAMAGNHTVCGLLATTIAKSTITPESKLSEIRACTIAYAANNASQQDFSKQSANAPPAKIGEWHIH